MMGITLVCVILTQRHKQQTTPKKKEKKEKTEKTEKTKQNKTAENKNISKTNMIGWLLTLRQIVS